MASVTKAVTPTLTTPLPCDGHRMGEPIPAGEDIAAGDACYIKSDGKIWRSTGAAANAAAVVDGFAMGAAKVAQRQTVTLVHDVDMNYATGLTPGSFLYLSGTTAGGLDTATSTGGTVPIARVKSDGKRLRVLRSYGG